MPLKITHKAEGDVPGSTGPGRINDDLLALKIEMQKLASGMVLEIETGSEKAVRGVKTLVTRASTQLGSKWEHWSAGSKVFAKPAGEVRRRASRRKNGAS